MASNMGLATSVVVVWCDFCNILGAHSQRWCLPSTYVLNFLFFRFILLSACAIDLHVCDAQYTVVLLKQRQVRIPFHYSTINATYFSVFAKCPPKEKILEAKTEGENEIMRSQFFRSTYQPILVEVVCSPLSKGERSFGVVLSCAFCAGIAFPAPHSPGAHPNREGHFPEESPRLRRTRDGYGRQESRLWLRAVLVSQGRSASCQGIVQKAGRECEGAATGTWMPPTRLDSCLSSFFFGVCT